MRVNQPNSSPVQTNGPSAADAAKKTERVVSPAVEKAKAKEASSVDTSSSAQASISSKAKDMARAKSAVDNVPDVREERIAELKRKIESGGYTIDANKIADRMVDEHLTSGIG